MDVKLKKITSKYFLKIIKFSEIEWNTLEIYDFSVKNFIKYSKIDTKISLFSWTINYLLKYDYLSRNFINFLIKKYNFHSYFAIKEK